jgi:hypothetical protein
MATIPTVPSFTDDTVPSIADLNDLSQAVSFLSNVAVRPAWHFYKTATQVITLSTQTVVAYNYVALDSDGVFTSGGIATIVTQGYYVTEACAGFLAGGASMSAQAEFLVTAGSSNPNHSASSTLVYGTTGGLAPDTANEDYQLCISAPCPWVLYPGDKIAVRVFSTATVDLAYNENVSYVKGRFAANFTGYYKRYGVKESTDT